MSTVDKLQLTKKRLQNLRSRSLGLQQLAARAISNQLTFYRTHPDELEKLKSLPAVLRDKILQVLMKKKGFDVQRREIEFENLKEIFPLLLSSRTRYIELNGILSFCPYRYKDGEIDKVTQWCVELLKQIETRAPQVETLIIKRTQKFYTKIYFWYGTNVEFNQDMVQSLMKMQRLNRLNVSLYCFNLNDLFKICNKLPRLQYLNVGLICHRSKNQPTPKDVSSSFCNLKEFIFEFPFNEWLGSLCTRNLPNIEVVECDPNQITEFIGLTKMDADRYRSLEFPGTSNLRNICLDPSKDKAKEVKAMPNLFPKVTCLMVKNIMTPSLEENVMPKFDNISQLHLLDPYDIEKVEKYLIAYGKNLQSLYLGNSFENSTVNLESIFKCCPKLEKLSLLNVCLQKPSSKIEFFAELKELEWANLDYDDFLGGIPCLERMDLSIILPAPKLEKVKLEAKIFNENDLLTLNSLIQEKRILNKLYTLHVFFTHPIDEAGKLKSLANVLKSACAFLPKLTDFKFGSRYKYEDPLLARQTTQLGDIDASVCEMNGVFENQI